MLLCVCQTQALQNLDAVLKAAGSSLQKVVKVNIFLSSMQYYTGVNNVYAKFFTQQVKPVSLPLVVWHLYPLHLHL